jgi:predicted O-methyltransferase YrrM
LLKIASYYLKINREDIALELYIICLLKKAFFDEKISNKLIQKYKQISNQVKKVQEHGQQILMDYINNDIDYLKSKANRKLTLIEIGTTREDVPSQGSTLKLANFCKAHELHFITVDMDPRNTKLAISDLDKVDKSFQAINQKGEDFLRDYNDPMDFIFLDAYDFDHGKHSEERQTRYKKYLGERISETACHQMHLECARQVQRKISPFGVVCFDDTWFKEGKWQAKGTLAVPYLLENNYWIVLSGNRSVLLTAARNGNGAINIINTLNIHLDYTKRKEINSIISLININISGRVCVTDYLHGLYLLKKSMGDDCKVYVETGTLFGGSLCLVMQDSLPCTFVGIDLFDGYYGKKLDPGTNMPVSLASTRENVDQLNVHKHDFFLIKGSSYENETVLKFKCLKLSIDLLLIDGDHSYQGVTRNFEAYKHFVNPGGFIVFDNYGEPNTWEEVAEAVSDINFENNDFERIGQYGYSYIVKKKWGTKPV